MSQPFASRDLIWFRALTGNLASRPGGPTSLRVADTELDDYLMRFLAIVSDPDNPFPCTRQGEGGLLEGWGPTAAVDEALEADRKVPRKRALLAIAGMPGQTYGHRKEALGIHQALAEAVNAYARIRLVGYPLIGLLVDKAVFGTFLAHGYQTNRLIALHDPGTMIRAMGKTTAARITLRSVEELEVLAAKVPPMAYDTDSHTPPGLPWRTLPVETVEVPPTADLVRVRTCLGEALADILDGPCDLGNRLGAANRGASARVHRLLRGW